LNRFTVKPQYFTAATLSCFYLCPKFVNTNSHTVPRSIMRGDISPLPQYASVAWCSVQKFTGIILPLPF